LSNLALSPAREGAATAPLGNLFPCFTTLMRKNFFPISHLNLPSFSLELFPLVLSLHTQKKRCKPTSKTNATSARLLLAETGAAPSPVTKPWSRAAIAGIAPARSRAGREEAGAAPQPKQTRGVGRVPRQRRQALRIRIEQTASPIQDLAPTEARVGNHVETEVCLFRGSSRRMLHLLRDSPPCVTFLSDGRSSAPVGLAQKRPHQSLRLMRLTPISFRMRRAESAPLGFQAANAGTSD